MRLDRFISKNTEYGNQEIRQLIACGRVQVDSKVVTSPRVDVTSFTHVVVDSKILQATKPYYFMLHKPKGCVSATKDEKHKTVIDLFNETFKDQLHISGRLDFNTSGLMLLTNDGVWSRSISQPNSNIPKTYLVETEDPITAEYQTTFNQGIYFSYEDITTQPADLEIFTERTARLTIYEGKYHQVKRMFGYFNNKVVGLHRECIGSLALDEQLRAGEYRELTHDELTAFNVRSNEF